MFEIKTAMDSSIYQFVLSIAGFIFVVMLGIIGFFLKKQVDATEQLAETTKALELTISTVQNNQSNFASQCGLRHQIINDTLTDHNKRISENTEKINEHSETLAAITKKVSRGRGGNK